MVSRQNTSSAVMAQRKSLEASLGLFPTPPWATRALLHDVLLQAGLLDGARDTVWEPACGKGHMTIPLAEVFGQVFATDVADWGHGDARNLDFSMCGPAEAPWPIDWVITNPPFALAEMFARRGLAIARRGVALLMRLQWLEGVDRHADFFRPGAPYRPTQVAIFAERVAMIEGAWDPLVTSATAYAWFIWTPEGLATEGPLPIIHIAPGAERRHARPEDALLASPGIAELRRLQRKAEGG